MNIPSDKQFCLDIIEGLGATEDYLKHIKILKLKEDAEVLFAMGYLSGLVNGLKMNLSKIKEKLGTLEL